MFILETTKNGEALNNQPTFASKDKVGNFEPNFFNDKENYIYQEEQYSADSKSES